jgi:hypothetical protein
MKTKLFAFSTRDFKKEKHHPLTSEMIYALLLALQKQERKIPFDFSSINGPLTTLIERGFILRKRLPIMGHMEYQWQVTKAAIIKLKKLGYHC